MSTRIRALNYCSVTTIIDYYFYSITWYKVYFSLYRQFWMKIIFFLFFRNVWSVTNTLFIGDLLQFLGAKFLYPLISWGRHVLEKLAYNLCFLITVIYWIRYYVININLNKNINNHLKAFVFIINNLWLMIRHGQRINMEQVTCDLPRLILSRILDKRHK